MKLLFTCALTLLITCQTAADPSTPAYWVERLQNPEQRLEAIRKLGELGDKSVAPNLIALIDAKATDAGNHEQR
jgi:hypothetical protein